MGSIQRITGGQLDTRKFTVPKGGRIDAPTKIGSVILDDKLVARRMTSGQVRGIVKAPHNFLLRGGVQALHVEIQIVDIGIFVAGKGPEDKG